MYTDVWLEVYCLLTFMFTTTLLQVYSWQGITLTRRLCFAVIYQMVSPALIIKHREAVEGSLQLECFISKTPQLFWRAEFPV